jgi:hypothetical protein
LCAAAKPGKRIGSHSVLSGDQKLISQCAKKFGVMNEMFVSPGALAIKKLLMNSMDPGRYSSNFAVLEGMVAKVYENLPESFYHEIEHSVAF